MKMIKTLTIVLIFFLLANIVYSNEANIDVLARSFIDSLVAERFTEIEMSFTEELSKAIPGETLKAVWESIISTLGKFNEILDIKITEYKEYRIASVICDFERGTLEIQITFDKELRIAGLYFLQPQFKATYTPPSYANQDSFTEIEVVLGDGKWKLPGLLTLPKTDKPYPAVVLVHGSGPNDKDETIGTNKPFKDLSWGLASRGIAVLRYEKRTRYYGEESLIEGFTANEEVIEDVISAVDFLYQREEIDKNKIFILGHSLGGMLAPRIAEKTDKVRGIIMLAGTIKDLQEIYQAKYGPGNYIPPVKPVFWSFRVMVLAALLMLVLALYALYLSKKTALETKPWFLKALVGAIVLPYLANTAGWLMAEIGRQPWIVQGLQRVEEAVSPSVSAGAILATLIGFSLLYGVLALVDLYLLGKYAKMGPESFLDDPLVTSPKEASLWI